MKRPVRGENGMYMVSGKSYKELFGSRTQVYNGTAYKTSGGLTKKHLMMNKWGRIVSEKKHKTAKKEKRLQKYGYFTEKGKFGFVKRNTRKSRSMKGGNDGMKPEGGAEGLKVGDEVEGMKLEGELEGLKGGPSDVAPYTAPGGLGSSAV
jgi:hypothetical protein